MPVRFRMRASMTAGLLAVVVQDRGEHAQRRARSGRRSGGSGDADPFGINFVVPGQFGAGLGPGTGSARFGDAVKT